MEYPNPVKITNWSFNANAYRNLRREEVDKIFIEADELENNVRYNKEISKEKKDDVYSEIKNLRNKGRQIWREIITISNNI